MEDEEYKDRSKEKDDEEDVEEEGQVKTDPGRGVACGGFEDDAQDSRRPGAAPQIRPQHQLPSRQTRQREGRECEDGDLRGRMERRGCGRRRVRAARGVKEHKSAMELSLLQQLHALLRAGDGHRGRTLDVMPLSAARQGST